MQTLRMLDKDLNVTKIKPRLSNKKKLTAKMEKATLLKILVNESFAHRFRDENHFRRKCSESNKYDHPAH